MMDSKISHWKMVPLGHAATLQRGFDLPVQNRIPGDVPVFAANGPVGTHCEPKVIGPGVITGRSGTIGKVHYVEHDYWPLNTSLFVKDFHGNHPKFIYYLLSNMRLERFHEGTGVPTLNRNNIHGVEIPLPPLSEQKRIADILDKADAIRRKRQEALLMLKGTFKSSFRELFGDPAENPKGFPTHSIRDLSTRISKGESPKWQGFDYQEEGVQFITSENVRWGELSIDSAKYIPEQFHEKLGRSQLAADDILVNLVGASVGRTCMVPVSALPANVNQAVAVISLDQSKILPSFLMHQLLSDSMQRRLLGNVVESARANISLTNVRDTEVIVPSLPEQQHWEAVVSGTEKAAVRLSTAYDNSCDLFNSLVQRAFKGEL